MKTRTYSQTFTKRKLIPLFFLAVIFHLNSTAVNDALKIKISGNNYSDETAIRFAPGATVGFDGNFDAWKLFSFNPNVPSIYTQIDSVSQLSINAFPELDTAYSISLYTKISTPGMYSLKSFILGAFASGVTVMMKDLQTGIYYNMLDSSVSHSFNLAATTLSSPARFILYFYPSVATGTGQSAQSHSDLTILQQNEEISIYPPDQFFQNRTSMTVFSVNGAVLFYQEKNVNDNEPFIYRPNTSGIYIIQLICNSTAITKKIYCGH